jgi:predicted nucleotidyltransferase
MKDELDREFYRLKQKLLDIGAYDVQAVGSRVTCNPIPEGADYDVLVYSSKILDIEDLGFTCNTEEYDEIENRFCAYRSGIFNIIATQDTEFFDTYIKATKLCKHLNLLVKEKRIALFRYVLYGELP